jgi:hypothetical protein
MNEAMDVISVLIVVDFAISLLLLSVPFVHVPIVHDEDHLPIFDEIVSNDVSNSTIKKQHKDG